MQFTTIHPQQAFVAAPLVTAPTTTSYVNLQDLSGVLEAYYQGRLDDAPESLARALYRPLSEWYPNSLMGQIDSTLLKQLLNQLTPLHQVALKYHYTADPELLPTLQSHYYRQSISHPPSAWRQAPNFTDFLSETFIEAINNLAAITLAAL